jgi:hypothetical protein
MTEDELKEWNERPKSRNFITASMLSCFRTLLLSTHRFYASIQSVNPLKPCVYVGMTGLPVDHRFENHKNGYNYLLHLSRGADDEDAFC